METVRRLALSALLAVLLATPAHPVERTYRIAMIENIAPASQLAGADPGDRAWREFVHRLRALGYVEGRNLILDRHSLEGRWDRVSAIVAELVRLKTDVIVTRGRTVTERAREVTTTVPIVMATGSDPVGAGLAHSLAHPGGNVTGQTSDAGPAIESKRLELLKVALPRVARVAYLGRAYEWNQPEGQSARSAAPRLGLVLLPAMHTEHDYAGAFGRIRGDHPDAVYVADSTPNYANRRLIVAFAAQSRLPVMAPTREFAELGALLSYGTDQGELLRGAADYVDRILKGTKPGDLPIEQPTRFEFVINLRTAKALGITILPTVLALADDVLQ